MGLLTKDIKTLNDLFVHQLQDIYYAEKPRPDRMVRLRRLSHQRNNTLKGPAG
jgi:ferritin-like metal-binding protein YciE